MPLIDSLRRHGAVALYHFTDTRNLPLIRSEGGLFSLTHLRARKITVPQPGGNDWSHSADAKKGVDHYVHLCFRPHHPMEHLAKRAGRIDESVFLEIDLEVLLLEGVRFTPDVANKAGVRLHTLAEAEPLIDFEVLYRKTNWSDAAVRARLQSAEKTELLVPHHVPLQYIRKLV